MTDRSSLQSRIKGSRATVLGPGDSLENINTSTLDEGALCYVTDVGRYELRRGATDTPDGTNIVEPIAGPGRWFLTSSTQSARFVLDGLASLPSGQTVSVNFTLTSTGFIPIVTAFPQNLPTGKTCAFGGATNGSDYYYYLLNTGGPAGHHSLVMGSVDGSPDVDFLFLIQEYEI